MNCGWAVDGLWADGNAVALTAGMVLERGRWKENGEQRIVGASGVCCFLFLCCVCGGAMIGSVGAMWDWS